MNLAQKRNHFNKYLMILPGFLIPVSTALTNVALALIVLFWIVDNTSDRFQRWIDVLKTNPVAFLGLIFFLIHVAGVLYTDGNQEKIIESMMDGAKFLFISMIMIYFKDESVQYAFMISFLSAMLMVLLLSCLLWLGFLPDMFQAKGNVSNAVIFHDHIKQNIFMAYTAFVTAIWARKSRPGSLKQLLWGCFSFLALFNVLFMVTGRTGHLIVLVLASYYLINWSWAKSIVAFILIFLVFGIFAWFNSSNPFFLRAQAVFYEVKAWELNQPADINSPSGQRLEFLINSLKAIKENPIIGTGTGSFKRTYGQIVQNSGMMRTDNPHNEFLMTAVQFGLVGVAGLLGFFWVQWRNAGKDQLQRITCKGFIITILIACMTASPLQDNAEGWFFVFMSALFFARLDMKLPLPRFKKDRVQ